LSLSTFFFFSHRQSGVFVVFLPLAVTFILSQTLVVDTAFTTPSLS
jgi:hypothetical protein